MSTVHSIMIEMLPRLPKADLSISFISAMQTTLDVLVRRLWLKKSDLLAAPLTNVNVAAGSNSFDLPADFLGLVEEPVLLVAGQPGVRLGQLPPGARYSFTQQGTPRFYEIIGTTCYLYPTPSENASFGGLYYKDPAKLTGMDSDIPFNGLFDPLLKDAVLQIGNQGVFIVATPGFEMMVRNFVDDVIQARNPKSIKFLHQPTGNQSKFRW